MRDYTEEILGSTMFVVENSDDVHISKEAITNFCEHTPLREKRGINWLQGSPFPIGSLTDKEQIHLMLTFNALSFSYWGDPYWQVTYKEKTHERGSWSLIASLFRAREEGTDILDPAIQSSMTKTSLSHILRGNREIPLLEERVAIIGQVGALIRDKYNGDFRVMIRESGYDAVKLLSTVVEAFPLFDDTAVYKGRAICFYKRAQALVESIDSLNEERRLSSAERLTALADYILPRKLRDEGILVYSRGLAEKIDAKEPIPARSPYEVEIRANTIWAVESIRNTLSERGVQVGRKQINDYLWITGNQEKTTFHRTRTTAY